MPPTDPLRLTNLPAEVSSFVGRRREMAELRTALESHRLITLTGPGGVGKTRLAFRVAAEVAGGYAHGAWVVELARVQDPALVPHTVASVLGLTETTGRPLMEELVLHLRDRTLLLVLDNCEHVQEACAGLVTRLLSECAAVHVIATSRHALSVGQGQHMTVLPLPVPVQGRRTRSPEALLHYDSVRLFVDRAAASWSHFGVTDANQQAVADLVRQLDGVPLAIELAAVRVRSLSVEQILDRLADRFGLLTRGDRAALPRQQTLHALLEWSHDLLSREERTLWERAAVFAGSFDLLDLEAVVCDADLPVERLAELADGLVAKSILLRDSAQEPRLYLLQFLKEYGEAKLQEAGRRSRLQRRHLDHYRQEVLTAAREMFGRHGGAWLHRLRAEHDDLRAALEHCTSEPDLLLTGCEVMGASQHYWVMTGRFTEGRRWAHRLLGQQPTPGLARVAVRVTGGRLAVLQGDVHEGRPLLEQGLEEATGLGSAMWRAHALHGLAIAALFWGDPAESRTMLEEALELHRAAEDPLGVPLALIQLATVHATLGDTDRAMAYAEECIGLSGSAGDQWCAAMARWTQALVVWREGRSDRARSYARDVLRLKEPFGDRLGMAMSMEMIAWAGSVEGRHQEAATLFGAVQSALSSIGGALFRPLQAEHDHCIELTRSALGTAMYDRHVTAGAALGFEDAVALARLGQPAVAGRTSRLARQGVRLTPRESEIARLVAEGLSNREIADRLVVAQRTAEGHVQRTLSKLGLTSRQQLAGWVQEHAQ